MILRPTGIMITKVKVPHLPSRIQVLTIWKTIFRSETRRDTQQFSDIEEVWTSIPDPST